MLVWYAPVHDAGVRVALHMRVETLIRFTPADLKQRKELWPNLKRHFVRNPINESVAKRFAGVEIERQIKEVVRSSESMRVPRTLR